MYAKKYKTNKQKIAFSLFFLITPDFEDAKNKFINKSCQKIMLNKEKGFSNDQGHRKTYVTHKSCNCHILFLQHSKFYADY